MPTRNTVEATTPVRVILDCDTKNEVDDQLAIAYALGRPRLEVLGVISVQNTLASGLNSLGLYHEEALRIVELSGRPDVPCFRGASRPMEHIDDVVTSDGLDFLIAACEEGPLTLLGTGPATDIAAFAQVASKVAQDRVQILWAGGFPDRETWDAHKYGELNARADIAAWRRVFLSARNLTLLTGWPAVETVKVLWPQFVAQLRELHFPLADYLAEVITAYAATRRQMDMDAGRSYEKVLWDIVNVARVSIPDAVKLFERPLPLIDPAGAPDWDNAARSVLYALEVDAEAIFLDFWSALTRLSETSPA